MNGDFTNIEKKPSRKKDFSLSIVILVFVFIVVLVAVAMKEYTFKEIFSETSNRIITQTEDMFSLREKNSEEDVLLENTETEDNEEETKIVSIKSKSYKEVAEKGEGLTHLARKAVTKYMEEEGIELSDEERIYVEDYVQKRLSSEKSEPRFLELGEEVEVPRELIEDGIEMAEQLTPAQVENLHQYTLLVSF